VDNYCKQLWTGPQEDEIMTNINEHVDPVTMQELLEALKGLKIRKTPGTDGMNKERFKYASQKLLVPFLDLINIC
jgi:hypothetical protein